ncbi:hypothetical protein MJO28_003482 [Puccinia striiformis f. sp. tritici]|uniref:Uncharacterized protein n=4 Tax=Puccinia striiformis TaxID=27350 RepID=A0A0L0VA73_9BASI|nr:hypothetical protein Pst134EB_005673 [Puccinia striiformis f. sp. tritici]KNE96182.1 hypothetical protein PSTG_10597 [Puccinia striiformis f. sp. tritici PST-78]POV96476.1 hypothetical protein PSHT_15113 [Puccinia striiformis]KAI7959691.1 hypothetical protein MJO28_003482 [Puccinia striiformis f. sp. tritici]KAI7965438.1 hypothetical protein MJO29_003536 [Puccinia striiformis f. sp. tritici]
MLPPGNNSPSQLVVSPRGPQSTPRRPTANYARNQTSSASPYQPRMRYLVGRGSPLTFSANHPLRNLVHENQLNDSSPNKIKSTSNTFQTPYQTPQHRHLPAHTPLRVRRMRKKIHLQENCEVGGYGARRLFKEEIYGISNHSMTHRERRVENGFDGGSSVVN